MLVEGNGFLGAAAERTLMDALALAVKAINSPAALLWFDLIQAAGGFALVIDGRTVTIERLDTRKDTSNAPT